MLCAVPAACALITATGCSGTANRVAVNVHARYVGIEVGSDPIHTIPNAVPQPHTCRIWQLDATSQGSLDVVMHFLVPAAQAQATLARVRAITGVQSATIIATQGFDTSPTADPGFPPTGAGAPC